MKRETGRLTKLISYLPAWGSNEGNPWQGGLRSRGRIVSISHSNKHWERYGLGSGYDRCASNHTVKRDCGGWKSYCVDSLACQEDGGKNCFGVHLVRGFGM
jgi:hypothetical protein